MNIYETLTEYRMVSKLVYKFIIVATYMYISILVYILRTYIMNFTYQYILE